MTDPVRIEAGEKQIAKVFSDDYAFTIPPYQRPYAWEVQQVTELLDDLEEAMGPASRSEGIYFLGSIVLVKSKSAPEAKVVDGQQRLTTLTILFSVLRDLTEDEELRWQRDRYIKRPANPDQKLDARLRLHLRQRDQDFFADKIQKRGATADLPSQNGLTGSRARIVENARTLRERLSVMTATQRSELISFLLNNCYLVVVEVPTDTAARRIFTVLNARGLDLAATDILKADLLERAGETMEAKLSRRWEDVETALDRGRFNELFTHIRMIHQREKPRSALEEGFKAEVKPFADPETFIGSTLEPFADAFLLLENQEQLIQRYGQQTAGLLRALGRIDNKDWVPPLLLVLKHAADNDGVDVPAFIKALDRLAYYLFAVRADVNERVGRYADVLDQIAPREGRTPKTAGLDLDQGDVSRLFDELDGPIYTKSRVLAKPLLLRLDQALTEGSAYYDFPTISVEHVCPQTITAGSVWDNWFSDREQHDDWLHRLANLVLLSHRKNSAASNWDLERKKTKYFVRGDRTPFTLTGEVLSVDEWTPQYLKERQRLLLAALATEWDLSASFEDWWQTRQVTA